MIDSVESRLRERYNLDQSIPKSIGPIFRDVTHPPADHSSLRSNNTFTHAETSVIKLLCDESISFEKRELIALSLLNGSFTGDVNAAIVKPATNLPVFSNETTLELTNQAKELHSLRSTILVSADTTDRRKIVSQPDRLSNREVSAGAVITEWKNECIAKSRAETLNAREEMRSKKESGYMSKRVKMQLMKNLQLFRKKLKDRMNEKKDSMVGSVLRSVDVKTADQFLARFEGCIMSVDEAISVLSNPLKQSKSAILSDLPDLGMIPMSTESSSRNIGDFGIHYDRGNDNVRHDNHVAPQRISKLHRTQVGALPREVLHDKLSGENAISTGSENTRDLKGDKSVGISRAFRATGDHRGFTSAQLNDMAACSGTSTTMEGYDATELMLRQRNTKEKLRSYRTRHDVQNHLSDKTDRRAENLLKRYIDMKETAQLMMSQSSARLGQGDIDNNMSHRTRLDSESSQLQSKFNDDSISTLSPRDYGPQTSTNPLVVTSTSCFSLKDVRNIQHIKSPSRGLSLSRGRLLSFNSVSGFQPIHLAVSDYYPNNALGLWGSPQRRDDGRLVQGSSLNDIRTSSFAKPKPFFS